MTQNLTITALARETGVSSKSLRYWEELGLLPKASRSRAGYRLFPPEAVAYVGFVKRSKAMGLTLKQMQKVLRLARDGRSPCTTVETWIDQRIAELETAIQSLTQQLSALKCIQRRSSLDAPADYPPQSCCSLLMGLPEERRFRRVAASEPAEAPRLS